MRCTLSIKVMSTFQCGHHTCEAYSSTGLTYILNRSIRKRMLRVIKMLNRMCLINKSEDISSLQAYTNIRKLFVKYNTGLPSSALVERLFSLGHSRVADETLSAETETRPRLFKT